MTYSPNSWTTTSEVLVKSATTTGVLVNVTGSTLATAANQTNGTQKTQIADSGGDVADIIQLSNVPVAGDKGLLTQSIIHGLSSAGGGTYVDVKVNPAGKLLVTADLEQGGTAVSAANPVQVTLANTGANTTPVNVQLTSSSVSILGGAVAISGTVSVTGPLTDAQIRATPLPVALTSSSVTIANNIGISGTVNVIVTNSTIPTGAATEANQVTANGWLQDIDGYVSAALDAPLSGLLTNTQLRATPVPVALTSSSVIITSGVVGISGTVSVTGPLTDTQLRANPVPVTLTGTSVVVVNATVTIGPIPAGTNNIGDVDILSAPTLSVNPIVATGATTTALQATIAAQTVAASNANRLGLFVFNEVESGYMYLRYGSNASAGSYSIRIAANAFWEMPQPIYNGIVTAAFSVSTTTSAKITEVVK